MAGRRCIDCNKEISPNAKRCRACAKKGTKNGHYKNGIWTTKNHCPICRKEILPSSKMCRSCSTKNQLKINNHLAIYNLDRKGKNHPMFGRTLSDLTKQKISNKHKNKVLTEAHKKKISKKMKGTRKGKDNPMFNKVTTSKRGNYNGIYMRSSWEIAYAKYLDKNNIKWQYEPEHFEIEDTCYTPDFYLPKQDLYIEIKGWWRDNAKKRFELFKQIYSEKKIQVLMKPELQKLGVL